MILIYYLEYLIMSDFESALMNVPLDEDKNQAVATAEHLLELLKVWTGRSKNKTSTSNTLRAFLNDKLSPLLTDSSHFDLNKFVQSL